MVKEKVMNILRKLLMPYFFIIFEVFINIKIIN